MEHRHQGRIALRRLAAVAACFFAMTISAGPLLAQGEGAYPNEDHTFRRPAISLSPRQSKTIPFTPPWDVLSGPMVEVSDKTVVTASFSREKQAVVITALDNGTKAAKHATVRVTVVFSRLPVGIQSPHQRDRFTHTYEFPVTVPPCTPPPVKQPTHAPPETSPENFFPESWEMCVGDSVLKQPNSSVGPLSLYNSAPQVAGANWFARKAGGKQTTDPVLLLIEAKQPGKTVIVVADDRPKSSKYVFQYSVKVKSCRMPTGVGSKGVPEGSVGVAKLPSGYEKHPGESVPVVPPAPPKPPAPPRPGAQRPVESSEETGLGTTTMVGVVVAADARRGDQISFCVVTDPESYEHTPGLRVVRVEVPADASGSAMLQGLVVDSGDGRAQPADHPGTARLAGPGLSLTFRREGRRTPATLTVPVGDGAPGPATSEPGYHAPPVAVGPVGAVYGRVTGNAGLMRLSVDGREVEIVAATPRAVFWRLPADAAPGTHQVKLEDRLVSVSFPVVTVQLKVRAGKSTLTKGETTPIEVEVRGPEALPAPAWRAGGVAPDLVDTAGLTGFAAEARAPRPGESGYLLFTAENQTPQAIALSSSQQERVARRLSEKDFRGRPFTWHSKVRARESGGFSLRFAVVPFFQPIAADAAPNPVLAGDSIVDELNKKLPGPKPRQPEGTPKVEERPDGSIVRTWPDGTREVITPDGYIKVTNPDGSTDEISPEGGRIITHPDGTRVVYRPDGSSYTDEPGLPPSTVPKRGQGRDELWGPKVPGPKHRQPAGTPKVEERPDGTIVRTWPDGTREVITPDGYITITDPDGTTDQISPEGGRIITHPDGSRTVYRPDGSSYNDEPGLPPSTVPKRKNPPDNPPGTQPPPTGPTQPPPPPPPPTQGEDRPPTTPPGGEVDCPQRYKGCVALVIDFLKVYTTELDVEKIAKLLQQIGCETEYVAPTFKSLPEESDEPDTAETKAVREYDEKQWDEVKSATAKHRERLAKGAELAIEIIRGHGQGAQGEAACGWVSPGVATGGFLFRDLFHRENYDAARRNVCSWFTADFSCYAGLTPKVVDELENLGTATCTAGTTDACGKHAGFEADASLASALSDDTCDNGDVWLRRRAFQAVLEQEAQRRAQAQSKDYKRLIQELQSFTAQSDRAHYTDRGYAKDTPPVHQRQGYASSGKPR